MASYNGKLTPAWTSDATNPPRPATPLPDEAADVCVVGAGLAGVTTAYLLAKEGKRVVVLDQSDRLDGETTRTSAHLASIVDDRFYEIERQYDLATARTMYESHSAAIDQIERIAAEETIDCDFRRCDAYLFVGPSDTKDTLFKEFAAMRRIGVDATLVDEVPATTAGAAILARNQGAFQPLKYLLGLIAAAERRGVTFHFGARVADVTGAEPQHSKPARVTLHGSGRTINARHVVVATNTPAPINDWLGIYIKQAAYRTYMVGLEMPAGSLPFALYWDTHDPYHYVRLQHGNDGAPNVLLVGGEDHKTGQTGANDDRFRELAKWARKIFPQAGAEVSRWSGQVQEPADGIAFIGHAKTANENVYVITGDSGMGMTHSNLGARLVADQILGRPNAWESVYDPGRKIANAEILSEAVNTNKQYVDYITAGEISSETELTYGQGGLMRDGLKKLAVYRDDAGAVHKMSAVCPHLGCIVHWNGVEKSWDCPCHGSRYTCTGEVIIGPSSEDLKPAE